MAAVEAVEAAAVAVAAAAASAAAAAPEAGVWPKPTGAGETNTATRYSTHAHAAMPPTRAADTSA